MIYSSLDIIPYKLFVKIAETGNVSLLTDEEIDIDILVEIWDDLYDQHHSKNQTDQTKKVFKLSKTIDSLITQNKVVLMACECLRFEFNEEIFEMLKGMGYSLCDTDTETYFSNINQIERESEGYLQSAENYKKMLPDTEEKEGVDKYSIDDVMASYSNILGFDFDYNLVAYSKFFALQNQVNSKIKSMQKQN